MADLQAKITEIIVNKLGVEESQVTPEASFTKDLGADSLDSVEMVMDFEAEFDVDFEESDQERIKTVQNVIDLLNEKLA